MCGIVGLFLKDKALEPRLGELLTDMLITMSDRGPDSAGIAVYPGASAGVAKLTVQADDPARFEGLDSAMSAAIGADVSLRIKDTHAVIELPAGKVAEARDSLKTLCPDARVMSAGEAIEIYKEVGLPGDVARPLRHSASDRQPWHRPYAHGDRIRGHHAGRASVHRPGRTSALSTTVRSANHNSLRRKPGARRACTCRPRTTPRSPPPI